jgi:hypothetical protein
VAEGGAPLVDFHDKVENDEVIFPAPLEDNGSSSLSPGPSYGDF